MPGKTGQKNICILNQHTCNRGDEAAGRAVIESLLDKFPGRVIHVYYRSPGSRTPIWEDTDRVRHFPGVELRLKPRSLRELDLLSLLLLALGFRKEFKGDFGAMVASIRNAEFVVNAPTGPNMGDRYRDFKYMANLLLAIILKKRLYIYGSSVGPFKSMAVRVASKFILNRVQWACLREELSYRHVQELGLNHQRYSQSIDAAIQRDIATDETPELLRQLGVSADNRLIGFTPLAHYWYPKQIRNPETEDLIVEGLASILNTLIERDRVTVVVLPQLHNLEGSDNPLLSDRKIIEAVQTRIRDRDRFIVVPDSFDSDAQQKLVCSFFTVIGMRYHSIIFAAKLKVPPIAITYEHKAEGFMQALQLEQLAIPITKFAGNPDSALSIYSQIEQSRQTFVERITQQLPGLQRKSQEGTRQIVDQETRLESNVHGNR